MTSMPPHTLPKMVCLPSSPAQAAAAAAVQASLNTPATSGEQKGVGRRAAMRQLPRALMGRLFGMRLPSVAHGCRCCSQRRSHGVGAVVTKNCMAHTRRGTARQGQTRCAAASSRLGLGSTPAPPPPPPTHVHVCTHVRTCPAHLAAVCVGPRIGHRQHPRPRVLQLAQDLVLELSTLRGRKHGGSSIRPHAAEAAAWQGQEGSSGSNVGQPAASTAGGRRCPAAAGGRPHAHRWSCRRARCQWGLHPAERSPNQTIMCLKWYEAVGGRQPGKHPV